MCAFVLREEAALLELVPLPLDLGLLLRSVLIMFMMEKTLSVPQELKKESLLLKVVL